MNTEKPEPPEGYEIAETTLDHLPEGAMIQSKFTEDKWNLAARTPKDIPPEYHRHWWVAVPATRTPIPATGGEKGKQFQKGGDESCTPQRDECQPVSAESLTFTQNQTAQFTGVSNAPVDVLTVDQGQAPPAAQGEKAAETGMLSEPPLRIWLQYHGDGPAEDAPVRGADVSWCQDRVYDSDVEYLRLDRLPADWAEDSSLETWFPLTAQALATVRAESDAKSEEIARLKKFQDDMEASGAIKLPDIVPISYAELASKCANQSAIIEGLKGVINQDWLLRYHNAVADAFSENLRASQGGSEKVMAMEAEFKAALARAEETEKGDK